MVDHGRTRFVALAALALIGGGSCSSSGGMPLPQTPGQAASEEEPEAAKPAEPEPPPAAANEPFQPLLPLPTTEPPAAAADPKAPADVAAPPADAERTASGLTWKVLKKGTGTAHPRPEDTVRVNFTGWMTSGVKFESNDERGKAVDFALARKIPGWVEGLQLMVEGEQRRFWIPGKLGYGDEPRGAGNPYGTLVYDIELVRFRRPPPPPVVPPDLKAPPHDAKKTVSGLAYKVLEKGTGKVHPRPGDTVEVHYSGWSLDGKMFDSSVERGDTATFPLAGVIRGWKEGLQLMVIGDRTRFWIPARLAYGERPAGNSPAGPLVFDVELIDIKDRDSEKTP
jgi:FKBP-type peptidyl-prolyl cis-trans isomerase